MSGTAETGGEPPMGKDQRLSFFIMPTFFLRVLREEYAKVSSDSETKKIMFRCGFRCGEMITGKMEIRSEDHVNLTDTLMALWIEVGLGRLRINPGQGDRISIESEDSTESLALGLTGHVSCDLTCGLIAGIASAVTNREYGCLEEHCTSKGDDRCLYVLHPTSAHAVKA